MTVNQHITRENIKTICETLGIEYASGIKSIEITPIEVFITRFARNEEGNIIIDPDTDDIVMVTTRIKVGDPS